ncbi:MAG: hypothetical protein AAGM21_08350 [Pseudomonadota bacterium]
MATFAAVTSPADWFLATTAPRTTGSGLLSILDVLSGASFAKALVSAPAKVSFGAALTGDGSPPAAPLASGGWVGAGVLGSLEPKIKGRFSP